MTPATAVLRHVALLGAATSIHLQRWAVGLHESGVRVSVITQHGAGALPLPDGVDLWTLPVAGGLGYGLNAPFLARLLARLKPDLLHVHYASGYGTTAMLIRHRPTLLSTWGSDIYVFPRRSPFHRWLLRRNLSAAQALAATSHAMAAEIHQLLGDPRPVAVTPFGVDVQRFAPAPAMAPSPTVVIGTVKTLAPTYGIDLLIRAFAGLRASAPDLACELRIIGDGPERASLESLARELGQTDRIHFFGAVPHPLVAQHLQQFDVYVAASRSESFGVAVVEAMAVGLPVIVSDVGGLPEVVEQERSGIIVPSEDVDALQAAMARLVADPLLRKRLGNNGRERAVAEYAWPHCIDTMLACQAATVSSALQRPGPPRPPPTV